MSTKHWKHLFDRTRLNRGENYYYRNRVHNLRYEGNEKDLTFQATVRGSHKYSVEGHFINNELRAANCTCPYEGPGYCKHIAAAIYSLEYNLAIDEERENRRKAEEEKQRIRNSRKQIFPFKKDPGRSDYFDLEKLTSGYIIYDLDYQNALSKIEVEKPKLELDFGYQPDSDYKGLVCFARTQKAQMRFSRDTVFYFQCYDYGCDGYYYYHYGKDANKLCVHRLMLLILVDRYLKEHDVGDSTDYQALKFLNSMRSEVVQKVPKEQSMGNTTVRLVPRITQNNSRISLSFRIGKDKLYNVKSLSGLVAAVNGSKEFPLGKNSVLDFLTDSFDDSSLKYYRFIEGRVIEHNALRENAGRSYYIPDIGSSIDLAGANMDMLFDLTVSREAEYVNKSAGQKAKPLFLSEKDPRISLSVVKDTSDGTFLGVKLTGSVPAFLHGVSYQYFLEDQEKQATLYRISEEASGKLEPIRKLGVSGDVSLSIGRKHLSEFYYDVLPILQESMNIEEPDAQYIEEQMPPKAEFTIYLDAIEKVPLLKIETLYDDAVFKTADMMTDTVTLDPRRDPYRESQALNMVRRYFNTYNAPSDTFHMDDDPQQIYLLLNNGLKEFTAFCQVRSTARFDALRIRSISSVKVGVSIESDLLNLNISSGDLTPEELLEILKSYKLKKRYHRLPNGMFVDIDENVAQLSSIMEALRVSPKEFIKGKFHVPAYRALYLDKMLENLSGVQTSRDRHFRELIKNFKAVSESDFETPHSLTGILRPYQTYGYQWMRTLSACNFGGILADDMGLGKTLQMICVLLAVKEERDAAGSEGNAPRTSLIICPASLVYNWAEEFARFAPSVKTGIVSGTKTERCHILENYEDYDVLITSYDLLKRDVPVYEDKKFDYQVLDEAQFIKTHTTAAAKSVKIINSSHRFALTGTPIENRLSELWSIFDYLMPGFLYGYETFKKDFETPIVKNDDEDASARLKRMVAPFILRRLKNEVLKDLPDKLEEIRYARFEAEQQRLYDAQIVRLRSMIDKSDDDQLNKNKIAILAELTRTRQICCDPSLLFDNYSGDSAKKLACLDLVRSAIQGEHRILLFSQFTSMLKILEDELAGEGIEYYKITGSTPKHERIELVKAFNEGSVPVFLISLKAGGTGLNLTGADIVIHYDPWWNIAAQNQATDRAHRIGQTRKVCVYKLIVRGTIEEKIMNMQNAKEKLADEILSGETAGISSMSRKELMELLL